MSIKKKLVLVADQQSLMKIYDSASMPESINIIELQALVSRAILIPKWMSKRDARENVNLDVVLEKIHQSLGLAAELTYLPFNKANNLYLGMGKMPKNNCFYISDLVNENLYIPLQEYNKYLSKEKNNAFMGLAAALGAKSISLQEAQFYNSNGKLETDFSVLKPVAMDLGINVNFEKDGSIKKEVYSSFGKPRRAPMIPANLQKWVDIDSDLELMANHRLKNGLSSHQISLQFNDSLEGAAEVAARITGTNKAIGFKASAGKHISSTWVFKVEYHSMDYE